MTKEININQFKHIKVSVQRQAKVQCANFMGRNSCVFYEVCKYYQDNPERCGYYESHVLPGDTILEAKYKDALGLVSRQDDTKIEKAKRRKRRQRKG